MSPESDGSLGHELLGRHRFAGERSLLDVKVLALEQARIGGNQIAGGKPDHITRNHLASWNLDPFSIAHYRGAGRHLVAQSTHRTLRTKGLKKVERDADDHHRGDNRRVDDLPEHARDHAGREQNQHQRIGAEAQELDQRAGEFRGDRFIGSEAFEALLGLILRQSARGDALVARSRLSSLDEWCSLGHEWR